MLNPLRSEDEAFRFLLYAIARRIVGDRRRVILDPARRSLLSAGAAAT